MIIETARVLRVTGAVAWVSCESHAGCQRCAEGRGCGGGVLGRLLGERLREVRVDTAGYRLAPGDRVSIGLSETALLQSSLVMYLVPLLTMLAAALIADLLAPLPWRELASVIAAVPGLLAGLALAREFGRRHGRSGFGPRVVGVVAPEETPGPFHLVPGREA
ncbi:MAG: SoxR reducing system RseC family protein [Gammaproteobacteria bacterium]|jgi:sigma-E factor negative regulatory protein RseC